VIDEASREMGLKPTWCYHTVATQSMWSEIPWSRFWEKQAVMYNWRVHFIYSFPLEDAYSQYCMGGWYYILMYSEACKGKIPSYRVHL
jgi:hypothetical protein